MGFCHEIFRRIRGPIAGVLFIATFTAGPSLLSGQIFGPDPEKLPFKGPEGWATRYFSSVILPAGFGVPRPLERGEWEFGLELGQVPRLSLDEQRVGFRGSKVDDMNHVPVVIRPSATLGLGGGFSATATVLPPVRLWGLRSTLLSLSLNRALLERGNWRVGGRVFINYGQSEGAFTCSQWLVDRDLDPFDCVPPSRDSSYLRAFGAELSASCNLESFYGWTPYVAVSWQYMNNHFQTDVEIFGGTAHDARTLKTEGTTFASSAGLEVPLGDRWTLALGLFYSPLEVVRSPIRSDVSRNDGLLNFRSQIRFSY